MKNLWTSGKDFKLRFVGTVSEKTKDIIISQIPEKSLEFFPYVVHSEAIKFMMNSSLLILIIPLHQSNKSIITGKLFEYMAAEKPVLCLGPTDGDAARIIKLCRSGETFDYYDTEKISEFLENVNRYYGLSDKQAVKKFSHYNLTRRIADVLESEENDG